MDERQRAANDKVMSETAKIGRTNFLSSIDKIFSPDEVKRIDAHCKKHDLERGIVIDDIVEAGMKANGIHTKPRGGRNALWLVV